MVLSLVGFPLYCPMGYLLSRHLLHRRTIMPVRDRSRGNVTNARTHKALVHMVRYHDKWRNLMSGLQGPHPLAWMSPCMRAFSSFICRRISRREFRRLLYLNHKAQSTISLLAVLCKHALLHRRRS